MGKIEELEKRIEELESFIRMAKIEKEDRSDIAIIWRKVTPDNEGFEDNFINKYSIAEFEKQGFPSEYKTLDFQTAIKDSKGLGDKAKKLRFWMAFQRKMIDELGLLEYRDSEYWAELVWFTRSAIRYYQDKIIERILKEGKHFEGSGNRPQWDAGDTVKWWDELYPSFSKKKTDVYNEIRRRHNPQNSYSTVPAYPSEKTIRTHLQKAGRI